VAGGSLAPALDAFALFGKDIMKSALRLMASILLLLFAGVLGVAQFLAIVDPVGTKMADDGDPFGDPYVPWYQHAVFILIIIACVVVAFRLMRRTQAN